MGCDSGVSGSYGGEPIRIGTCKNNGIQPNPVVDRVAVFTYQVQTDQIVRLYMFDETGNLVAILLSKRVEAGTHTAVFDLSSFVAGKYTLIFNGYCESVSEPITMVIVD